MTTPRMPTTAEISRAAGVNKSTVSRALKSDPRISDSTRKRILDIAERMGYAPNALAQSLATSNSNIVAFIGHETQNYWYQENIQTLARLVTQAGRQLMLFQVMQGGTIDDVIPQMIQYRVAGCIVIPAVDMTGTASDRLSQFGISVVLLNRPGEDFGASSVRQDMVTAARGVAHFLVRGGHERIALISGNANPAAQNRKTGFLEGLRELDTPLFAEARGEFTFRDAYAAATALLTARERPDAIFAANDMMAFATIEAARALGVSVPGDVSVIGYDNGRVGAWPGFALTTVAQPIEAMFSDALGLILARQRQADLPPEAVAVGARLLLRGSARVPERLDDLPIACKVAPPLPG